MTVIDEVIVTLELYQLIALLLHIIKVEGSVFLRTVIEHHLTFCIEIVTTDS